MVLFSCLDILIAVLENFLDGLGIEPTLLIDTSIKFHQLTLTPEVICQ